MREINKIILHCSDSIFGDRDLIDGWHRSKGFKCVGYHYIILNGRTRYSAVYDNTIDGILQIGRDIRDNGAHCVGENSDSIGICLIGIDKFTDKQINRLTLLISGLRERFGNIPILGHYETKSGAKQSKTCPNIFMPEFRKKHFNEIEMKPREVK